MDALLRKLLVSIERKSYLASGGDKNQFWILARWIREHIGSPSHSGGRRVLAAINGRHRLSSERDYGRFMPQLHRIAIALNYFVCIRRTQDNKSGNCAQRAEMLDRLMSRSIFAVAHCLVCEDEQ